jgi:hypothetical protein
MTWIGRHRYLLTLVVLIVSQVAMALIGEAGAAANAAFDVVFALSVLCTLWLVCLTRRARIVGAALLAVPLALTLLERVVPVFTIPVLIVTFHALVAAFLAFALATILAQLFRHSAIDLDRVFGAFAGYLLIGVLWGNLYAIVALSAPDAFSVSADIRWELQGWHERRALFNYLSFATLSSLGYADIVPVAPIANTLTWLEVMAAQFYMAVVIAMIVGARLAHSAGGARGGSR